MSFLGRLFGTKPIKDDFFGKMEVDKVKVNNDEIHYFTCSKSFPGQSKKVDIIVLSNDSQISQSQRDVARKLINNYPQILAEINTKIQTNYATKASRFNVKDITNDFILTIINIHQENKGIVNWDLNYTKGDIQLQVEFAGDKIDHIDIDRD